MNPFHYVQASDAPAAIRELVEQGGSARFLAGGTNLIDLMRQGIERPRAVVDISRLPLTWRPTARFASAIRCCRRRS
jgi:xanthine dehydrogenase YagS FAD-binding subunit